MRKAWSWLQPGLGTGVLLAGSLLWTFPAAAHGQESGKQIGVDLGIGTWVTVGETRWSHNASSQFPLGNPTSLLMYDDHSANLVELTAKLSVGPRWFGRLIIGGGRIGGGRLTDDDFLMPDGGHPSLRTVSDIDGAGVWYFSADVGTKIVAFSNGRGRLDGLAGFHYWRQRHHAYGVRQQSCSPAGATLDLDPIKPGIDPLCSPGSSPIGNEVLAVSNTNTWYSLRIGLQTEYRLMPRLGIYGSVIVKPVNLFTNEDTHHLRVPSEFQDPSFTMLGVGFGADAEIGASVFFTPSLSAQAGYRVWWNRIIDGNWRSHLADGRSQSFPLAEMESLRHGFTAGISYRF